MRLKMLRSLGHGLPQFLEGETVETDCATAELLISRQLAVEVPKVPVVQQIPEPAAITDQPADPEPVDATKPRRQAGSAKRKRNEQ